MKTSAAGVAFICSHEGFVDHVYRDAAGIPTIGYGHVLRPGDPVTVTQDQARELMARDLAGFEAAVNADVKVPLAQPQFDALVSFAYNVGAGALAHSGVLSALNAGNYAGAADAMLQWCKRKNPATGALVTDAGLLSRRKDERALFLSQPPASSASRDPSAAPVAQAAIAEAMNATDFHDSDPPPAAGA
jgi:lysozyme